jgi:hypothetical protein
VASLGRHLAAHNRNGFAVVAATACEKRDAIPLTFARALFALMLHLRSTGKSRAGRGENLVAAGKRDEPSMSCERGFTLGFFRQFLCLYQLDASCHIPVTLMCYAFNSLFH